MQLNSRFLDGFFKSWGVILASEIGDKTFFIAAVMAMRNSRRLVFAGAMGALAAMTVLSAALGWAAPNLISKKYTHYAATLLFFFFGARMLWEAAQGAHSGQEELDEVEKELQTRNAPNGDGAAPPAQSKGPSGRTGLDDFEKKERGPVATLRQVLPPVLAEAFTLTFLAEWGDRSQIATIGLAAASDVVGVTLGGIVGHALCTGAAVLGGKHLASHIDERMVAIFGGLLFLAFGGHALLTGPPA